MPFIGLMKKLKFYLLDNVMYREKLIISGSKRVKKNVFMTVWLSVDISSVVTYFNGIFHYKKKLQCLTIKLRLVNISYSFQQQVRRRCSCISLFHCCPKSLSMRGPGRPDTCHLTDFFSKFHSL